MTIICQVATVLCVLLLVGMGIATGLVAVLRIYYGVETITLEKIRDQWSFDVTPEGYKTGDVTGSAQTPGRNP